MSGCTWGWTQEFAFVKRRLIPLGHEIDKNFDARRRRQSLNIKFQPMIFVLVHYNIKHLQFSCSLSCILALLRKVLTGSSNETWIFHHCWHCFWIFMKSQTSLIKSAIWWDPHLLNILYWVIPIKRSVPQSKWPNGHAHALARTW